MSENRKTKVVKKRRKAKPLVKVLCVGIIAACCALLMQVGQEILTTMDLRKEVDIARAELAKIQEENAYLKDQQSKLQDEGYVQNYARGHYMMSKEGEQIFYLPETEK